MVDRKLEDVQAAASPASASPATEARAGERKAEPATPERVTRLGARTSVDEPEPTRPLESSELEPAAAAADELAPESWRLDPATRTPPDRHPVGKPDLFGRFDLSAPSCFLNRELTWLGFNVRVLREAEDMRTPLLERVKFIAIVFSNLDEFFMKRIGGLKQQVGAGIQDTTIDGRTPQEQIDECCDFVRWLEARARQALQQVMEELREHDILLALGPEDQAYLRDYYFENIFPLVTPQATDPAHPFPFISNLSLNLLVTLRYPGADGALSIARVKVPVGTGIPRLLKLQDRDTFVPLESVMAHNLDLLFPGMQIESQGMFRVTRNANTERDEDRADDLLALIETELQERRFAPVVRLEVVRGMRSDRRGMLAAELGLDEDTDVFEVDGLMAIRDLIELTAIRKPSLHDPPHHPVDNPALQSDQSIFHIIRSRGAILLHHPYESYTTSVERFLREASQDPKVRAIKMILYRTSAESKAISYLVDAARNDKQVAVVVELKARFDEQANIGWANRLEEAGIHVTYGVVGLKTHSKAILVVRQDYDGLKRYAHIGTGNHHAETARLYSDLGLLTCSPEIGMDLTELFNYLSTGYKPKRNYQKLLPAPKLCKQALIEKISREILHHNEGSPGLIQFKTNAIQDSSIVTALYKASQASVKVDLIARDTCCLRPGVPGLSDNIRVISIVGRFLEHSRIYYFRNGGDEEYYIGSADCMTRNLNSRVEVLVPVEDSSLREKLRFVLDTQLGDPIGAWEMQPDGSYLKRRPLDDPEGARSSQQAFIDRAEKQLRQATRLRRRRPRGLG
jgi:polyphosphate kinase